LESAVKTERVTVASLLFDPANVRKHGERNLDSIKASLARFGQQKPIVVDGDGIVRAGNGTLMAAKALGWDEIEIVRTNLRGSEATAYAIADNRTAELAEWDEGALAEQLAALQIDDETLAAATGFDASEIERMALPVDVVEDEVPEVPVDPITKPGDLWVLGDHRLLCGDSTKADDVERLMAGAEADLLLTDPPYGVAYQTALSTSEAAARHRRKDGKEVVNDNLGWDGTRQLVADAFKAASIRPGAAFYVFCPPGDLQAAFFLGLQDAGYNARHQIVWVKDRFVMGRCDYHYRHEVCLYGWADGAGHYFVDDRTQDSVWECKRPGASKEHPTMKPVELFARCVQNSSKKDWSIYEPFSGSGTTLIAAEQLGRKCYGMEISPAYCDVIVKRWETLTGKKATLAA
jgi:site-specific DNA-methyltransferase (adenine-specific)